MTLISVPQAQDGVTGVNAASVNSPVNVIANDYNGNVTDANISSSAAINFSKVAGGSSTALGVWQSWVPSWTNLTVGNGTLNYAKFVQIGKFIEFRLAFTLGSTTSVGSAPTVSLPVTANSDYSPGQMMNATAHYFDSSAVVTQFGQMNFTSTTTAGLYFVAGTLATQLVTSTGPFTWAITDQIFLVGSYEAA